MPNRVVYELALAVRSPFMFEGLVNDRLGIDSAFIRGQDGEAIIPAAQVKGVLRDVMEHLAAATSLIAPAEIDALFGVASAPNEDEQDRPSRGLAYFADLSASNPGESSSITRIAIDDETGVVKTGHLQVVELAAPLGAIETFTGRLVIRYSKGLNEAKVEKALNAAIRLIPSIGAYKSAGFGEIVAAECRLTRIVASELAPVRRSDGLRAVLDVRFDRPILVDTIRHTDNAFFSSTIIPGSAFKGALAERLALAGENPENAESVFHEALSRLHISHARPLAEADGALIGGDLPIPQSLFYVKTDKGYLVADAITAPAPGSGILFKGVAKAPEQVAFAKHEVVETFRNALGLPAFSGDRLIRTHVGLNEDGEGARLDLESRNFTAADEKLYSTSTVSTKNTLWRLIVDGSNITDKEIATQLLGVFSEELDGIGRTAATASFTEAKSAPAPNVPDGPVVDILLVTPAVLFDPIDGGQVTQQDLGNLYASYFERVLGTKLINYFARPIFAGQYPAVRRRPYGKAYYPFVQTKPGAVFRLAIPSEEARKALTEALQFGLPVPTLGGKAATWKTCPFVPENGYGAITIHQPRAVKPETDDQVRWLCADEIAFVEGF